MATITTSMVENDENILKERDSEIAKIIRIVEIIVKELGNEKAGILIDRMGKKYWYWHFRRDIGVPHDGDHIPEKRGK